MTSSNSANTTKLTILYTYYGQKERIPGILKESHPQARVVIVDDGHPDPLAKTKGIQIYRIEEDIPWNQPGARNLGFQESRGWIVCADIDHLITRKNVEEILKLPKKKGHVYYLGREDNNSWNVYLIHKEDFEKIGGYDEDFCGHYGYDDIMFLYHAASQLRVEEVRDIKVKVHAKESSTKMERNAEFNRQLFESRKFTKKNGGKRVRFKWHKL